jgi:putative transposase
MQNQIPNFASIPCILAHRTDLLAIGSDLKFEGFELFYPCIILWPMEQNNDIRHGRHCLFLMHVHLVFVTKYRHGVFTKEILNDLRDLFSSVCRDFEAELVEFNGEDDHVHLLVNYPPKVAVSSLVNSLKGVSSRMIRKKNYPNIRKKLWGGALWSPSYFAGSCDGAPIEIIRQYIEQQQTPN